MKTEAQVLKSFGIVMACICALIAVVATTIILTSCSAIEKDKAQIEQIADDIAEELIEEAIEKVENK